MNNCITARKEGRYEKIASSRPCGNSKFLVHSPKYLVLTGYSFEYSDVSFNTLQIKGVAVALFGVIYA